MGWVPTAVCFVGAAVFHAVLCRVPVRMDFVLKAVVVGLPFGMGLVGWSWLEKGWSVKTCAAALTYGFLFELYIFFFTLVSTSVSVSLLLKLGKNGLLEEEIERLYSSRGMVAVRFEKLVRAGFLRREGRGYRLSSKAKLVLIGFRTLRFFFRHPVPARVAREELAGTRDGA